MTEEQKERIHRKIGKNVAKFRNEKGFSQLELSLAMGHKSISILASAEIYARKKHFNIIHLYQIAEILQIDINQLLEQD